MAGVSGVGDGELGTEEAAVFEGLNAVSQAGVVQFGSGQWGADFLPPSEGWEQHFFRLR